MRPLRRLVALIVPHWPWLAIGALLGIASVGSSIGLMGLSAYLISKAAVASGVAEIALAVTGVRVLAVSRAGSRYLERYTTHVAMFRVLSAVRAWFYRAIEPLAPARLSLERSGDLLDRAVADVDGLEDFYIRVLVPPVVAGVVVAATSIVFGVFDLAIGLVLLAFLLLSGVLLPLLGRRLSSAPTASVASLRGEVGALVLDEVEGVADLIVLDAAADHRRRLLGRAGELDAARRRLGSIEGVSDMLSGLFASLAALSILVLAIPLVTAGRLEGVFLAALPLAAVATFEAVQPLSRSLQLLDATRASAARLFELIDEPPPVLDPPRPAPPPRDRLGIEIRGLTFSYPGESVPVLDRLDLTVAAGERLAIVGPSGSGKSTLVSLLARLWDYRVGSIRIGGRELHELAAEDVRALLSVVPQDVHLFGTSIRDNLLVADGSADDARIEAACRTAQLWDLVESLPLGLGTPVGEHGLLLSGGERRRVAIARAILKDAPIAILDEATADLDARTEAALWESLEPWLEGRTVLLISHRPSVTLRLDRVVHLAPAGSMRP